MKKNNKKNTTNRKKIENLENNIPPKKIKENIKKKSHKKRKRFIFIKLIIFITFILTILFLINKAYTFKTLVNEMFNNSSSTVFDSNKNIIAKIGDERNRKNIRINDIPTNLINAYISIEDKRYYSHHGIDIKRTGGAILSYVINKGSSSFGGSTITQQLVKNLTMDDSNTIKRKIKEWFYALSLEIFYSKDQILEAYLNIIYTGPNIYGVQEASTYYFNKNISDLTLAECSFLAGLNNSPNSYNPFTAEDKSEKIKKRSKTVLYQMLDLGYITQDEYNNAISEIENGLSFEKGNITNEKEIYSYNTDALINEIISDISNKKHISTDFATNYFILSGSYIYSTENIEIQKILENESKNKKYILSSSENSDTSQIAMVLIDHSTGHVVASIRWLRRKKIFKNFK